MSWTFEFSLMIFLIIVFASQAISIKTRSRISLPFSLGIICIIGFVTGLFPPEFIEKSKMKDVGFIAFNVLIIHSGTMLDFKKLKMEKRSVTICCSAVLLLILAVGFGLAPFIGKELALISVGPIIGGGAACAIASISISSIRPDFMVYPWMIFMFQGFFGIPLCSWAIKKESIGLLDKYRNCSYEVACGFEPDASFTKEKDKLCDKIPKQYKTTAYYLGFLMIISVFNRWLYIAFFAKLGIHITITALIFGIILGQLGIIDKKPLLKSDSMGFLMLGLIALMGNTLAKTPLFNILSLILPVLIVFIVATSILVMVGVISSKVFGFSIYKGIALTVNCMVGYPANAILVQEAIEYLTVNDEERQFLKLNLMPPLMAGFMLIVNIISIFLASFVVVFL